MENHSQQRFQSSTKRISHQQYRFSLQETGATIVNTILAAIDNLRYAYNVAAVFQATFGCKEPRRATGGVFILRQQFRLRYQVDFQAIATVAVIGQAGDLDKTPTAIEPAITRCVIAITFAVNEVGDCTLAYQREG
jgi:hypothetical protein